LGELSIHGSAGLEFLIDWLVASVKNVFVSATVNTGVNSSFIDSFLLFSRLGLFGIFLSEGNNFLSGLERIVDWLVASVNNILVVTTINTGVHSSFKFSLLLFSGLWAVLSILGLERLFAFLDERIITSGALFHGSNLLISRFRTALGKFNNFLLGLSELERLFAFFNKSIVTSGALHHSSDHLISRTTLGEFDNFLLGLSGPERLFAFLDKSIVTSGALLHGSNLLISRSWAVLSILGLERFFAFLDKSIVTSGALLHGSDLLFSRFRTALGESSFLSSDLGVGAVLTFDLVSGKSDSVGGCE
jgi:hypothetical protein